MDSNNNLKSPRNGSSLPSPRYSQSSSSSTNSNIINNETVLNLPKPITRSEPGSPYPTTFVQADPSSFKQVVQMLTGSAETAKQTSSNSTNNNNNIRNHIPPIKTIPNKPNQSGFKLYERRNSLKNLKLNPLSPVFSSNNSNPSGFSPRNSDVLSPSILDFPALVLSPVTPLIPDPFNRNTVTGGGGGSGYRCGNASPSPSPSPKPVLNTEAEEKAIKEKGFFLHPSPGNTPRDSELRLLPLFPTTSPRASGPSSSSTSST
ncbi:VQ motif-containing protein 4 [Lathyrus oleraceus]|uniref:VQ domain-containing protein n=1 Tax=Pisum sativum TaxID=3888 RepID=A0A9D4VPZ7_PEA|nr:VQ motif-containing protein 4-like [Pisum sativum]KAI5386635.1 hypothetical protein KIW84_072965 [Pisum sativum]